MSTVIWRRRTRRVRGLDVDELKTADGKAGMERRSSKTTRSHHAGVYILVTSVQGRLMAAAYATRDSAMAAAVEFVQAEAETWLTGSLAERYERARRHVEGQ